jgi:type IV secretory pathway VirB3-like protein
LWTYSFHVGSGNYDDASTKASALSGIAYAVIMFSCIIYGLLFNWKKSIKRMLIGMLTLASIGVLLINFV